MFMAAPLVKKFLAFWENLKGDYHCKIPLKKPLNIPTKLSVCFAGDYDVQKNPPITLTLNLTKTIHSSHPISFKHWLSHYNPLSPKWILLFRFSKQTLYYILLYHMHATWHIFLQPITLIFAEEQQSWKSLHNLPHPSVPTSRKHQIFSSPTCSQ